MCCPPHTAKNLIVVLWQAGELLQQEMASLMLLILLISLGLGYSQTSSTVCNCTEQLQAVKNELRVEMQASISAVRKDVEALRNATKLLLGRYMLPDDSIVGEQCTTDQLEQMLGSVQQGIMNISSDGFRQLNLTIQQFQNDLRNQVTQVQEKIANISVAGTFQNPANSCQQLAELSPSNLPGYFWVSNGTSSPAFVYCTPNAHCCSSANIQGWMRVANLDMTDPSQGCPTGFKLTTSPKRGCFRTRTPGCTPITFSTHGITYSKVCGRVKGYLYVSPDAFWPYYNHHRITLDSTYLDGVSITQGRTPRQHIWTFVATQFDNRADQHSCPCSRSGVTFSGVVPPFINNDYFCEKGTTTEPMWDGGDCPSTSSCCSFNNPPWFCKQFSRTSTNDIEVRVCTDEPSLNEDIQIELIELYIQ